MAVKKVEKRLNKSFFTNKRLNMRGFSRLCILVERLGSIRAAALELGMSGQTAWRYATGRAVPVGWPHTFRPFH